MVSSLAVLIIILSRVKADRLNNVRVQKRSRNWCFTLNNPEDGESTCLRLLESESTLRLACQIEEGEEGTPHVQGFLTWKQPIAFKAIKARLAEISFDMARAHLEMAQGSPMQNFEYCTKEPRLAGPWTKGKFTGQGKRNDLVAYKDFLLGRPRLGEILAESPQMFARYHRFTSSVLDVAGELRAKQVYLERVNPASETKLKVICLYGLTGSGKTSWAFKKYGWDNCWKWAKTGSGTQWFDGYEGQQVAIIDDFYGQIKADFFLQLLDIYPMRVQIKNNFTWWTPDIIVITSNVHPREWYPNIPDRVRDAIMRRIEIIEEID